MASGQVTKHSPGSLLASGLSLSNSPANLTQQATVESTSVSTSNSSQHSRSSSSNGSLQSSIITKTNCQPVSHCLTNRLRQSPQRSISQLQQIKQQQRPRALIWPICSPPSSQTISAAKIPIIRDGVHQSIRLHRRSLQEEKELQQQSRSQIDLTNTIPASQQNQRSRLTPVIGVNQLINKQRATSLAATQTCSSISIARSSRQKVTPTPATTNSRVRQGLLLARRQYHISPSISASASKLTTTLTKTTSQQPIKALTNTRRTSPISTSSPSSSVATPTTTSHASSSTNKSPLSTSQTTLKAAESSKSLALVQQQQRRKLFNRHQVSIATTIPKSSSRFSLTSSTSSLSLSVVKRVKPSPQVTSSTSTRSSATTRISDKFSVVKKVATENTYRSTRSLNSANSSSRLLNSRRIVGSRSNSAEATDSSLSSSRSSTSSSPSSSPSSSTNCGFKTSCGINPKSCNRLATRASSLANRQTNGTHKISVNVALSQHFKPTVAGITRKPTTATQTSTAVASAVSFNQLQQRQHRYDNNKLIVKHQNKQNFSVANHQNNIPIPTAATICANLHLITTNRDINNSSNNNNNNINNNNKSDLPFIVAYDKRENSNQNQSEILSKITTTATAREPTTTIATSELTFINRSESGDDQMVIGSPLVTPPPSESDTDIENDENHQSSLNNVCDENVVTNLKVVDLNQQLKALDIPIRLESICGYYDLEARPFARGKFAQVKRCVKKTSNHCFAAKCIKKRRRLVDIRHEILLEIEALKLSYYTNRIVKLYEVFETPTEMILVLEMANGGELQRVLDDEEVIEERLVKRMVQQILEGLEKLHDNDIAHLDIKPQNLLLTESFPNGDIKLCDFGISRRITKDCEIREICGTPDYVAPEILRYDPITLATDMWSLGVLTYVLLSGYSPFGSENKQQTFCNITQATLDFPTEIFDKISKDAIDFMRKLIVREPSERLTSRQARNHPWLAKC